jgi:hypothetical protein
MILRAAIFLAFSAILFSAAPTRAADPTFPLGSRIGLVPPAGFELSKHFPGFENADTDSSIVLVSLPPQAFAEIEATLTTDAVRNQGVIEDKREVVTLPTGRGLMVVGTEEEKGQKFRKWMFLGAVPEGTILASARVSEGGRKTYPDDVIQASLTSIVVRPMVPITEVLELLPFKLSELSGLRPVRAVAGSGVLLTDSGKEAAEAGDQAALIVSIGQGGPESSTDRANFARNLFTGLADFTDVRILSGDMLRLGGGNLPTHELQAEAKDVKSGTPVKLVQWVRFGSTGFIRMVGVARADQWLSAFSRFRAVRDGIAPRE